MLDAVVEEVEKLDLGRGGEAEEFAKGIQGVLA
jgi:hypothetical protein